MPMTRKSDSDSFWMSGLPNESECSAYGVAQARLDRAVKPTLAWSNAKLTWLVKFLDREAWPSSALRERQIAIGADVAVLDRQLQDPPDSWTGEFWLLMHDRLRSWQGQIAAIDDTLKARHRANLPSWSAAAGISKPGSAPSISTAAESDPFSLE